MRCTSMQICAPAMRLTVLKVLATLPQQYPCCRPTASVAVQASGDLPSLQANGTPASPPQRAAGPASVPRADSAFAAAQPKGEHSAQCSLPPRRRSTPFFYPKDRHTVAPTAYGVAALCCAPSPKSRLLLRSCSLEWPDALPLQAHPPLSRNGRPCSRCAARSRLGVTSGRGSSALTVPCCGHSARTCHRRGGRCAYVQALSSPLARPEPTYTLPWTVLLCRSCGGSWREVTALRRATQSP